MNMATKDQPKGKRTSTPKTLHNSILQRLKAHDEAVKDTPFASVPDATQPTD